VVVALLGAACGDDDDGPDVATAASTTTATSAPTTDPTEVPTGASPGVTDPATGAAIDGGTGSAAAPTAPAAPAPGSPPAPAAPSADAGGPPGSFAPSLLRPAASTQLVLELQVAPGAQPAQAVVDHVRATLAAATGKPVSVTVGPAPAGTDWDDGSIRAAADAGATTAQGGGTAVLRLLLLRGSFAGDDGVLGVAVRGDVAAVFVDRAEAAAGLLGDPQAITTSVATHEVGHLLGLVDLVLDTGRADPDHPGHSRNPGSVMYWAVESDLISSLLGSRPPRDFDADDLADLRAIAGG
jgi:hypothetical protein